MRHNTPQWGGTIQSYSGDTSNSCWYAIGALAGVAAGGRVDNCAVAGYTIQADVRIDKGGWGGSGIGGLVGISHLNLENDGDLRTHFNFSARVAAGDAPLTGTHQTADAHIIIKMTIKPTTASVP